MDVTPELKKSVRDIIGMRVALKTKQDKFKEATKQAKDEIKESIKAVASQAVTTVETLTQLIVLIEAENENGTAIEEQREIVTTAESF